MQTQEQLQPHQYPKRILVVVSGMSPQILTETLYALIQRQQPAFVPTEIHLVSTASGARHARLTLLEGDAQFLRLCNDYGLDPAIFTVANIHTICDAHGNVLDDIRTPADNEAAADFITGKIRELADTEGSAIHVSMAGGRKTMGYYAGYALSLYGRPQDRLSHVLVSEGFEGHRDFYYPTPASKTIYRGEGKPALDAREAEVDLAEIPFVRMREELPEKVLEANPLLSGKHGFADTVRAAEEARGTHHIILDMQKMQFTCNGKPLEIDQAQLLFMCWLAERQHYGEPNFSYGKNTPSEILEESGKDFAVFCREMEKNGDEAKNGIFKNTQRTWAPFDGKLADPEDFPGKFSVFLSRLKKEITEQFGKIAAEKIMPQPISSRDRSTIAFINFQDNYRVIPARNK